MPKKIIKRFLPDYNKIKEHKHLQIFGKLIHDPNLWHLNRRSVSGAFSVGLFMAFVPVPFQMVLAAAAAIPLRVNLPISAALVWISNPLTMPPLFYGCYKFGAWVLNTPVQDIEFVLSIEWLMTQLGDIWAPFLLGCFLMGTFCALISNLIIRMLWRSLVLKGWQERRRRRKEKRQNS
ncbi:MAG: DUF2062 domain-containing protein [Thiotrichaceae bacterium]|nr:DUF2062 domain-containing protein [Thiotrichaceae bacterium]PCI14307.1 MAG: flagellar biosynthesis protein FlhF [Thiotrichales bacterium]